MASRADVVNTITQRRCVLLVFLVVSITLINAITILGYPGTTRGAKLDARLADKLKLEKISIRGENLQVSLLMRAIGRKGGVNIIVDDSDGDGVSDYNEINKFLTNEDSPDSDSDGLTDGEEIYVYGI